VIPRQLKIAGNGDSGILAANAAAAQGKSRRPAMFSPRPEGAFVGELLSRP